jgi:hypothetical protein
LRRALSNGSKMLSVLAQLLFQDGAAKLSNPTFLPAPRSPFLAVPKFDPQSVACAFHLPGRCCPSVTIFTGQMSGTAPRSPVRDHAVGGCSHRERLKRKCSTLSTACHLPCHPKGGFPARAAPYAHPQSKDGSSRCSRADDTLSTFCCCLLAARTRDVLRL